MSLPWSGRAVVVGAGNGIDELWLQHSASSTPSLRVLLCGRESTAGIDWSVDLESPPSLEALQQMLIADSLPLRLVINATGLLHRADGDVSAITPEKRLQQVDLHALNACFAVNAAAPLLLAKAIEPCLERSRPFHYASLSARVGSITDNRSGGWYAYRGAKSSPEHVLENIEP